MSAKFTEEGMKYVIKLFGAYQCPNCRDYGVPRNDKPEWVACTRCLVTWHIEPYSPGREVTLFPYSP